MARKRADRVLWGEGLLVCPQHFQQHDLFLDADIQARTQWPNPYGWGLSRVDLDPAALKTGSLQVRALRAILPSGLVLELDEGDPDLPPARPIAEHFGSTATLAEVHVAVPSLQEGTDNASSSDAAPGRHRYETWSRDVLDLVDAGTEVNVTYARPRPVVLFGSEKRDGFDTIKVAELRRDNAGGFERNEEFIPVCLRLTGSEQLRTWTTDLLSALVTKRRSIMDALRHVDSARVEFTAQDVTRSLQLSAINQSILMVRHVAENPEVSPFVLYGTLARLAGALCTFSTSIAPEELPLYDHGNPRATFPELFAKLGELLDLAMKQSFVEVPLEARRDGMWIGLLKDQRLQDCKTFVVAVEIDSPEQEAANRIPQLSKIASWQQIPKIVRSAIPGAPLKSTHRPPPGIPIRPRTVYFLVDTGHDFWKQIMAERSVAIFIPAPYDPSRTVVRMLGLPGGP